MEHLNTFQAKQKNSQFDIKEKNTEQSNGKYSPDTSTVDVYHTDSSEDLLCTSSATDCTGLIPAGITDDELEAYEQLYPYLPVQSGDTTDR